MPRARNPENASVFVPGQLSYLPKRRDDELLTPTESEIPDGCYDHPVLILSIDQHKREAVVLILTSFRGKSLDEHSPLLRIRAFHLPIHPSPAHPENGILLYLDQDLKLPKKTYVKTENRYSIRWKVLQADYREYRTGKMFKLKPESFATLLKHIKHGAPAKAPETPPPVPVTNLPPRDLLESMRANSFPQYRSISQPAIPPLQAPNPPQYSVRAPVAASTPQSVARSREGVAADLHSFITQYRGAQTRDIRRQDARSVLPTYHSSTPSGSVASSYDRVLILRRLFMVLLVVIVVFLMVAWWRCELWVCK